MSEMSVNCCLFAFSVVVIIINSCIADNKAVKVHPMVRLEKGYSVHEAPILEAGKPTQIDFSINVRNVLGVNEKEQLISLETSLRMYWRDPRVILDKAALIDQTTEYVTLNPKVAKHFWIPDIFLDRAKEIRIPTFFTRPASLRVYNNSLLRYSSRFNFDMACIMDFRRFPVDEQLCEINFESFGHTNEQLIFAWQANSSNVNPNITLAQFLIDVDLEDSYATDYYDLAYPGIIMRIRLSREIGYHVVQTYIPSVVFVALAWLSMFIPPESVPGRVGMGMTTLLTLTAMFSAVRQEVPRVSYISFLDIWMVVCIIFVFACIMEFTVVTYALRKERKGLADKIEVTSRIFIPVAFLLFNTCYWPLLYA